MFFFFNNSAHVPKYVNAYFHIPTYSILFAHHIVLQQLRPVKQTYRHLASTLQTELAWMCLDISGCGSSFVYT